MTTMGHFRDFFMYFVINSIKHFALLWLFCFSNSVIESGAKNKLQKKYNNHTRAHRRKTTPAAASSTPSPRSGRKSEYQRRRARQEAADCAMTPVYLRACMGVPAPPARRKPSAWRGSRGLREMEMRETRGETTPCSLRGLRDQLFFLAHAPDVSRRKRRRRSKKKKTTMASAAHSCRGPRP